MGGLPRDLDVTVSRPDQLGEIYRIGAQVEAYQVSFDSTESTLPVG
jgi:hypothetical protein